MRINPEINKKGYFWSPENDGHKISGELIVKNGGEVVVKLLGRLEIFSKQDAFRLYGILQGEEKITLEDCSFRKLPVFGNHMSETIIVSRLAILGIHCNAEELKFKACYFSIDGIVKWLNTKTFDLCMVQDDEIQYLFSANPPEKITEKIDENLSIDIITEVTSPSFPAFEEMKFKQNAYIIVNPKENMTIKNFQTLVYKISLLLNFFIDKVACINTFGVILEDNSRYAVYYQSKPFAENMSKIEWHNMLIKYTNLTEGLGAPLQRWIKLYDEIGPALFLFFYAKNGEQKYLDGRFLSLIQCLETYHRRTSNETLFDSCMFDDLKNSILEHCPEDHKEWLEGRLRYGNEISLKNRIDKIISQFHGIIDMRYFDKKFSRSVVDTRNYLTHYDKAGKSKAATGHDLYKITQALEGLFQLIILRLLGFTDNKLKEILNNNSQLNNKVPYHFDMNF